MPPNDFKFALEYENVMASIPIALNAFFLIIRRYHKGQINGADINAGAVNICVNVQARTMPACVCSVPTHIATLGWLLA